MTFPINWEPAKAISAGRDVPVLMPGIGSDEIAQRAYQLWERRGCPLGSPDSDWYQAEAELKGSLGKLPD